MKRLENALHNWSEMNTWSLRVLRLDQSLGVDETLLLPLNELFLFRNYFFQLINAFELLLHLLCKFEVLSIVLYLQHRCVQVVVTRGSTFCLELS